MPTRSTLSLSRRRPSSPIDRHPFSCYIIASTKSDRSRSSFIPKIHEIGYRHVAPRALPSAEPARPTPRAKAPSRWLGAMAAAPPPWLNTCAPAGSRCAGHPRDRPTTHRKPHAFRSDCATILQTSRCDQTTPLPYPIAQGSFPEGLRRDRHLGCAWPTFYNGIQCTARRTTTPAPRVCHHP